MAFQIDQIVNLVGKFIFNIEATHVLKKKINSLYQAGIFTSNEDPYGVPPYAAFHQGLHCFILKSYKILFIRITSDTHRCV